MTEVAPPGTAETEPEAGAPRRCNVVGLIALILAVVATLLACLPAVPSGLWIMNMLPGAWGVGMILLPVAFAVSVVSLALRGRRRAAGVVALIVTVVGATAFGFVLTDSLRQGFGDALGQSEGTHDSPYALGSIAGSEEWSIAINSVMFDATDSVLAESPGNAPPADGNEYILVNITIDYLGDDEAGAEPEVLALEYVAPDGATVRAASSDTLPPDAIDLTATFHDGEVVTGNLAFEVPSQHAEDGLIAITQPGLFGQTLYFSLG